MTNDNWEVLDGMHVNHYLRCGEEAETQIVPIIQPVTARRTCVSIGKGQVLSASSLRQLLLFFTCEKRRGLLVELARKSLTQGQLAHKCGYPDSTVRYHLNKLEELGFVIVVRQTRPYAYQLGKNITVLFGPTKVQLTVTAPEGDQFSVVTPLSKLHNK